MPNDNQSLSVVVRSTDEGHWVEWNNDGETGRVGPYEDAVMAEEVRTAKERELAENEGHIDNA